MRRLKLYGLVSGTILASMAALALLFLGNYNPTSAQSINTTVVPTITLTTTLTPGPVATTPIITGTTTTSQSSTTLDSDSFKMLLANFENTSTQILIIIRIVVFVLGISAFLGTIALFWRASELINLRKKTDTLKNTIEKLSNDAAKEAEDFRKETSELKKTIEQLKDELQEAREVGIAAINHLSYLLDARDRDPNTRIQAVRKIGKTNDITAVSILSELLETDQDENVKIEVAYSLGQLLKERDEPETLQEGIQALLQGTKDNSKKVRVEVIEALDTLVCSNVPLPPSVDRRIKEIVDGDTLEDVVKAARDILGHLKQQRERVSNLQVE